MSHLPARALPLSLLALTLAAPAAGAAFPQHAKVVRDAGDARFVGGKPGKPLTAPGASPKAAAQAFVARNRGEFGLAGAAEVKAGGSERQGRRGHAVRLQQEIGGVEVLGGQLTVQLDAHNRVLSVLGEVEDAESVQTAPKLTAGQAEVEAVIAVAKHQQVHAARLTTGDTALKIFNDAILGGPRGDRARLVWATEVTDGDRVRRLVLVDAEHGAIAASIERNPHARDRRVCDADNLAAHLPCEPGAAVLSEGGSTAGMVADVADAYTYAGATYDYLLDRFGRDSIDGKGMPLVSTVRYCDPSRPCPLENAFWNGSQMTYGTGFAASDDVVAHEFAHGVTEFTAGLYYYFQSGAINESMSDVFGELIDHVTPSPNDAPADRWQMGESLSGGSIRNMQDPTLAGDPDSMLSDKYLVTTDDEGGVHANSGVNNKAAYLLVDGGTFRGTTVTAIGAEKTAQIYYAVLTGFLTSGSDYKDLGLSLVQACDNLTGEYGITAADCQEVRDAVTATAMLVDRPEAVDMPECPAGQGPSYVYLDQIEAGEADWVTAAEHPKWQLVTGYATSGLYSLWTPSFSVVADAVVAQAASRTVPAGAFLRFSHAYEFEASSTTAFDGGVVEVSTNGGSSWQDAVPVADRSSVYDGPLGNGNPLGSAGRLVFSGISAGYTTSVVSLAGLAGQSARLRFRAGHDGEVRQQEGWSVDDVGMYTCLPAIAPGVGTGAASGVTTAAATVAGSVDPNGFDTSYVVEYGAGTLDRHTPVTTAGKGVDPVAVSAALSGLQPDTTYSYRITAVNPYGRTEGETKTFKTAAITDGAVKPQPTATPTPTVTPGPLAPTAPAALAGRAKAVKKGVKAARLRCANAGGKVKCTVTFAGARNKKRIRATLKQAGATVARGSAKKGGAKGLVRMTGAASLFAGPYDLVVKVGRKSFRFRAKLG